MAMLRGVLRMSAGLSVGFRSSGSPLFTHIRRMVREMYPPGGSGGPSWCGMVFAHRGKKCISCWNRMVARAGETGKLERGICHAGSRQYSIPVRMKGRMRGAILSALAVPQDEGGSFKKTCGTVRDLPGARSAWKKAYETLADIPGPGWRRYSVCAAA